MAESELLRLKRVVVDRLFDIYDHDIHLKLDNRVTLLHGPNGVGKTVVLGMIDALLGRGLGYIRGIPFSRFCWNFMTAAPSKWLRAREPAATRTTS